MEAKVVAVVSLPATMTTLESSWSAASDGGAETSCST